MNNPSKVRRGSPFLFFILCLSLLILLGSATFCMAAKEDTNEGKNITMDFDNVDVRLVIKFMSDLIGKNFIIDDGVKGNVTIISPKAIPLEEAYKVFESILEVKGFAAVPAGSVVKIVPIQDATSRNIEMRTEASSNLARQEDTLVTQLIQLEQADVNEIKNVIAPLVSKESKLIPYPPTNTLILTETASNIDRLIRIIKEIDVPTEETTIKVLTLKYASPDLISKTLLSALADQKVATKRTGKARRVVGQEASKLKVIPDERTGALIIVALEADLASAMDLIEKLDIPTPRGKDNIRVRFLKNSKAEDVSKVLSTIVQQQRNQAKKGGTETSPLIEGSSIVTADKATNSLIITASPQDYEIISRIIDELDILRPQVLVEALIAEVSFDKMRDLGVEWRAGVERVARDETNKTDYLTFAGTNFGQISSVQSGILTGELPQGMFVGVAKGEILGFPNIAALIRAYQRDSDVNILSTPHILTSDNEEAKIVVGQEVPYQQSEIIDNKTRYSYIYKDIGITLRLVPYINPDGYVKMEISLKIDNVIPGTATEAPWTTKREADTTVVVRDQQTVVIGGLLKDDQFESFNRVPCLGEIPFLGWAFRYMSHNKEKTNLQVFLTPHIINTPEDLFRLTMEKETSLNMEGLTEKQLKTGDTQVTGRRGAIQEGKGKGNGPGD